MNEKVGVEWLALPNPNVPFSRRPSLDGSGDGRRCSAKLARTDAACGATRGRALQAGLGEPGAEVSAQQLFVAAECLAAAGF